MQETHVEISLLSCRYEFICMIFSFATHDARALSVDTFDKAIRSRRVMREEDATKHDDEDARAGRASRRFYVIFILHLGWLLDTSATLILSTFSQIKSRVCSRCAP